MNKEFLDSYEDLIANTEEIRESLDILHDWLSGTPDFENRCTYYDLIVAHGSHFALLNLIMFRLDSLIEEHTTIVKKGVSA